MVCAECLLGPSALRVGALRALRTPCLPPGTEAEPPRQSKGGLGQPDRAEARLVEAEAS